MYGISQGSFRARPSATIGPDFWGLISNNTSPRALLGVFANCKETDGSAPPLARPNLKGFQKPKVAIARSITPAV